jgi:hypothetical protein
VIPRFTHFAAVDWSGAAGERHHGIALALIGQDDPAPRLLHPAASQGWSRPEVLEWLLEQAPPQTLIGFDLGQSLPHADSGAYFPDLPASPATARELWALVEQICAAQPHLAATTFADHPDYAPHFRRHGQRQGAHYPAGRGRLRVTEHAQAAMGCAPTSNFNLVGAAQVGKGSLAGMRLLHRLPREVAVWPIDPLPVSGKVVVEIYTTIAAMAAGRSPRASKIRDHAALATALATLGCKPRLAPAHPIPDHAADALITAAWLRGNAHRHELWHPSALTAKIAQTEGWTFGAL